jgi:hypothetical protein
MRTVALNPTFLHKTLAVSARIAANAGHRQPIDYGIRDAKESQSIEGKMLD